MWGIISFFGCLAGKARSVGMFAVGCSAAAFLGFYFSKDYHVLAKETLEYYKMPDVPAEMTIIAVRWTFAGLIWMAPWAAFVRYAIKLEKK